MADEFEALEPQVRDLPIGGQRFSVGPITMDRLPAFARALRPILPVVAELSAIDEKSDPQYVTDTLMALVSDDGESMVEAVAIAVAADKADIAASRARVGRLDPAEFLTLALPVVKANADFFARRLLPVLVIVMQQARAAKAVIDGAGPTPSTR